MEKIISFLCFITLSFSIISCNDSEDCCATPYEIIIINISKKERRISLKLYKEINNIIEDVRWSISSSSQSIASEGNQPIELEIKKDEEFSILFSPYENNIENIGKENVFYYEIYEDDQLIIDKKITIKSSYLNLKDKDPWELETDLFEIENKDYVKRTSKNRPFIKLEF